MKVADSDSRLITYILYSELDTNKKVPIRSFVSLLEYSNKMSKTVGQKSGRCVHQKKKRRLHNFSVFELPMFQDFYSTQNNDQFPLKIY